MILKFIFKLLFYLMILLKSRMNLLRQNFYYFFIKIQNENYFLIFLSRIYFVLFDTLFSLK
jgi:hypothetical protein